MKTIAAALVFGLGIFSCNAADAQYPVYQAPVVIQSAPVYSSYAVPVQAYSTPIYSAYSVPTYAAPTYTPARPGLFGRLIELERRKNAWLRETFLGRP